MPQIYKIITHEPVKTALFELLTASRGTDNIGGWVYIEGFRFITVGTPEWEQHLQLQRKILEGKFSPKELDRLMKTYAKSMKCAGKITETSGLEAISYFANYQNGSASKRIIMDAKTGIIAELTPESQGIDIFTKPTIENALMSWGYHARKCCPSYAYDGTIQDALREFAEKGYQFSVWTDEWNSHLLRNGEKTIDARGSPTVTGFEEVLRMAAI